MKKDNIRHGYKANIISTIVDRYAAQCYLLGYKANIISTIVDTMCKTVINPWL